MTGTRVHTTELRLPVLIQEVAEMRGPAGRRPREQPWKWGATSVPRTPCLLLFKSSRGAGAEMLWAYALSFCLSHSAFELPAHSLWLIP